MFRNMYLKSLISPTRINVSDCSDFRLNGKKVEIAVKQIVSGNVKMQVSGTVGNPESLEEYRQFVEVERVHKERYRGAKI
jgi:hypothetical protein